MKKVVFLCLMCCLMAACTVSYKFRNASIDYNITKTLYIANFPNQAPLVYPPFDNCKNYINQEDNEEMKDIFTRNTKLRMVDVNADMEIEGEIVGYELTPMAVQEDAYASETKLTVTVRMRFTNNKVEGKDKEETFSANRTFSSNVMLDQVQDQLTAEIIKELVDQIFNSTMADW